MTAAFRSVAVTEFISNGAHVANMPAGVVLGDALIAYCITDNNGDWTTTPSGWTKLIGATFDQVTPDGQQRAVYWRSAGASEPSTYTFTDGAANTSNSTIIIAAFSGASTVAPTNWSLTIDSTAETTGFVYGMTGVTASAGSCVAWFSDTDQTSSNTAYVTYTAPSGFTNRAQTTVGSWISAAMGTKDNVTAGATGTLSSTTTVVGGTLTYGLASLVIEIPALATGTGSFESTAFYASAFDVPSSSSSSKSLAISISETNTFAKSILRARKVGCTVSEAVAGLYTAGRARIMASTIVETISDALVLRRSRSVGLPLSEAVAYVIDITKTSGGGGGPKVMAVAIAEVQTLVIAEALKRGYTLTFAETEAIAIAALARAKAIVSTIAENTSNTGSVKRTRGVASNIVEVSNLTMSINRLKSVALALAETYSYSISAVKLKALASSISELDTFTFGGLRRAKDVASTIAEVVGYAGALQRTRTAAVTLNEVEVVSEALNRVRQVQEAVAELETVSLSLARKKLIASTISELETLTNALTKQVVTLKLFATVMNEASGSSFWLARARAVEWTSTNDTGGVSNTNMVPTPDAIASTWSAGGLSVTSNAVANPLNGTVNAVRLSEITATPSVLQLGITVVSNTTYTFSVYVKPDTMQYVQLRDATMALFATYNLAAGTVNQVSAACTASITPVSGGWFRISFTHTPNFGNGLYSYRIYFSDATNSISPTYSAGVGLWAYGPKFEIGSTASSYFPATQNGELEAIVASFNRGRAYVLPIAETNGFTLDFKRLRKQLVSITETQGVSSALARIRTVIQSISNATSLSFTVTTFTTVGGNIRVVIAWNEWVTDGIYQRMISHSEEVLCVAKDGTSVNVQTSDGATFTMPAAEGSTVSVETIQSSVFVIPSNSL